MKKIDLSKAKKVFILGVGGIGVSAIARFFHYEGKEVSGMDIGSSPVTDELEKNGIRIIFSQKIGLVPKDCDVIIYSTALLKMDSDFLESVKKLRKPMLSYPEALGLISEDKFTIAVSGTHGKTTTTAMIARVMIDAGLDPTVIIGSLFKDTKTNFIHGLSRFLVVEADEYHKSYDYLFPKILVLTNIGEDHLDIFKNIKGIQKAFKKFVSKVPKTGHLVADAKDGKVKPVLSVRKCKLIDYGEYVKNRIRIPFPGKHNRENAACALAVASILKISKESAVGSLEKFSGTWRRFDFKGKTKKGVMVYDDYAHNPDKIRAALSGFRELFPDNKIVVVFQPHLYSRTKLLLEEFSKSFGQADEIILAPIFAAREKMDSTISSEILALRISKRNADKLVHSIVEIEEMKEYLSKKLRSGDVLVTMGAGDIYKLAEEFLTEDSD